MQEQHKKNEMMDRPIVQEDVLDFMRNKQRKFAEPLHQLEMAANEQRIPIIPHETGIFLEFLLNVIAPKEILEIGMAVGFSASLMAYGHPERHIDTIDRYDLMIEKATQNFEKLGLTNQVNILIGDAVDVLPTLTKEYDFIFMDSAKAKYYDFFPYCMERLKVGGILMIDDVFQAGTVFHERETIPKRVRKIHKKLNMLLDEIVTHPALTVTSLPLGDGVLLIRKNENFDFSYMLKKI